MRGTLVSSRRKGASVTSVVSTGRGKSQHWRNRKANSISTLLTTKRISNFMWTAIVSEDISQQVNDITWLILQKKLWPIILRTFILGYKNKITINFIPGLDLWSHFLPQKLNIIWKSPTMYSPRIGAVIHWPANDGDVVILPFATCNNDHHRGKCTQ